MFSFSEKDLGGLRAQVRAAEEAVFLGNMDEELVHRDNWKGKALLSRGYNAYVN